MTTTVGKEYTVEACVRRTRLCHTRVRGHHKTYTGAPEASLATLIWLVGAFTSPMSHFPAPSTFASAHDELLGPFLGASRALVGGLWWGLVRSSASAL